MKITPLILALAIAVSAEGWSQDKHPKSNIKWQSDLKGALEQARKEGKLVLLHFGTESCTWCKKMDAETFSNQEVGTACAKGFIAVALDADREKDLTKKYGIERVPTAAVLLPEGELVEILDGYAPAGEFSEWLSHVAKHYSRYRQVEDEHRKSPDDPEAVCRLAEALLRLNQSSRAAKAIRTGLALFSKDEVLPPARRRNKAELLVHLGDAYLDLGESPKKMIDVAQEIDKTDPGGKLGFEIHAMFLRAATDDLLAHELEEGARELESKGKKAAAAKNRADARKLETSVLSRLEECLEKYPESDRTDAILMWLGHLVIEVRNDPVAARKIFERVTEKYPNSVFLDEARQKLRDLSGEKPKSDQKEKKP
jgi:thioredoxin-related protein